MVMDGNATITIGAIALIITLAINVYNWLKGRVGEAERRGHEAGTVATKLDQIISKISNVEQNSIDFKNQLVALDHRLTAVETKCKIESAPSKRTKRVDTGE